MTTPPKTRKVAEIFGLGPGITVLDEKLTGAKLPTNRQVLRCLLYHIEDGLGDNLTKTQAANLVLLKVKPFYEKANIPMIQDISACKKMVQILESNAKFRAILKARGDKPNVTKLLEENKKFLSETFQLWTPDAESIMTNAEDIKFLLSMKTYRSASFGSFDAVLDCKMKRKYSRVCSEERRREEARK